MKRADRADLLAAYESLLRERAIPLGLIAESDAVNVRRRHVDDSLRATACLSPDDRTLADIGSGAGLPGIPIAIAAPAVRVTLIEPVRRKAAFLELAAEHLGLSNVEVRRRRVQDVSGPFDVCTARAFAGPVRSWLAVRRLIGAAGRLLYFAGTSWSRVSEDELADAGAAVTICSRASHFASGPVVIIRASAVDPTPRAEEL